MQTKSSCLQPGTLGDAICALDITKDGVLPEGSDLVLKQQQVIMVLLRQLSSHLPVEAQATCNYLSKSGIITTDAVAEWGEQQPQNIENTATLRPQKANVLSRFETDFEQLEVLGRGAFGEVWRCRHRLDGREYAIKVVRYRADAKDGSTLEHRVHREAQTLARLPVHPGVLRYYNSWVEVDEADGANTRVGSLPYTPKNAAPEASQGNCSLTSMTCQSNFSDVYSDGGVTFCEPGEACAIHEPALIGENSVVLASTGVDHTNEEKLVVKACKKPMATLYIQTELCNKYTMLPWIVDRNAAVKSTDVTEEVHAQWNNGACKIFSQCVDVVGHLHKFGCVHRDIKPSNIFFGSDGRVQIGDFGIAKTSDMGSPTQTLSPRSLEDVLSTASTQASTVSTAHTLGMGTPTYASPEQLSGGAYGTEADVFSLGVILAELLCPVQTQMERSVLLDQFRNARRLPDEVAASFPATTCLALAMTDPNPQARPSLENVAQVLPTVLREMRDPARNSRVSVVPKIEEVEEQMVCIALAGTQEVQITLQEPTATIALPAAAAEEAGPPQEIESTLNLDPSKLDSEKNGPDPNSEWMGDQAAQNRQNDSNNMCTKTSGRQICKSKKSAPMFVDKNVLLLFLLCHSALLSPFSNSGQGSGGSKIVQGPTSDIEQYDSNILDLMQLDKVEYFTIQETFIHISSAMRMERTSSASSSSSDCVLCAMPANMPPSACADDESAASHIEGFTSKSLSLGEHNYNDVYMNMNAILANVFNILSRCTTSAK